MNPKMYLDGLESLDEDLEPGLLSELRMESPDRLHKSVMSEVRNQKKKKFYMNYKFYMPVAAAVLVAGIFVNGGMNFVNQLYANNPVKNVALTPQPVQNSITPAITGEEQIDKTNSDIVKPNDTNIKPAATDKGNTTVNNKTDSAVTKPSAAVQDKSTAQNSNDENAIAMDTNIDGKDIVASSGTDTTTQNSEMDSNINLEITANAHSEVISFLKTYGTLTDDGKNKVYKLSTTYFNQFSTVLEADAIEGKVINGSFSADADLVIRLVINE